MEALFALLLEPAILVGLIAGIVLAILFHCFAPVGTDTVSAGAWFVGLGVIGGLIWQMLMRSEKK